jgi:hypothetical protein
MQIPPALPVTCPVCAAAIPARGAWGRVSFFCPECGHGLRFRKGYFRVLYLFANILVAMVAYACGARGDTLFAIVVLAPWPTVSLLAFVTARLFPPDVEPTGDFHGVLYGLPVETDDRTSEHNAEEMLGPPARAPTHLDDRHDRREPFVPLREPRTLEGVALRGAALVLLVSVVWMAGLPLVRHFVPDFGIVQTGPAVFPITLRVRHDTLAFTNGSTEAWTCRATLGFDDAHAAAFPVEAHETRVVSYEDFQAQGRHAPLAVLRDAARERVSINCAAPSGRTHFWIFD